MNNATSGGAAVPVPKANVSASDLDPGSGNQPPLSARQHVALAVANVGVWEFEAATGMFTLDPTERRLRDLGEKAAERLPEATVLLAILSEDRERVREALHTAATQECGFDELFQVQVAGEMRWLHSIGHALSPDIGGRLIGVSFDATAEGQALVARDLLLREMNHRIKNLFAVIGGMISLCAREAESPRALAEDLGNRIAAMGRAHSLTQDALADRTLDLRELVEAVIEPTRTRQKIVIEGEPLDVPIALATPLSLIFHEWATNAAKYGALAEPDGSLCVRWSVDDAGLTTIEWEEICVHVANTGLGRPGFGTRLIEATVAQLRAQLTGEQGAGFLMRRIAIAGLG
jgi:two-component system CheB/CheR fusion protein